MRSSMSQPGRVVSSEAELLILVDEDDNPIGQLSKADCHDGAGRLHRAFSVLLFDSQGRLLLQRRAPGKRLWPGYWSNSCCSHPRVGESLAVATERRLADELNSRATLEFVYRFSYCAQYRQVGVEREVCHVFLGRLEHEPHPNEKEIDAIRMVSIAQLEDELARSPESFTPWFVSEWQTLRDEYSATLARYAR